MFDISGEHYFRYYTTSGEISGIGWLSTSTPSKLFLFSDKYTRLRIAAYSDKKYTYISSQINPPLIDRFGYVLSGYAGNKANVVFSDNGGKSLQFSHPSKYLIENKNLIYSNPVATIFR
jgi:hypothetical protein